MQPNPKAADDVRGSEIFKPVTREEGYFLTWDGMKWFWDHYSTDANERAQLTASPLRAA